MIENNNKPVVFVVDDDPHIREALHGLIRSLQLNVQTFGTSRRVSELQAAGSSRGVLCLTLDSGG